MDKWRAKGVSETSRDLLEGSEIYWVWDFRAGRGQNRARNFGVGNGSVLDLGCYI